MHDNLDEEQKTFKNRTTKGKKQSVMTLMLMNKNS